MGGIHRLKKSMSQQHAPKIAMADAHVAVNGCQVFLCHPDPNRATASAKGFKEMLCKTIARAKCVNLHDMYLASFAMRERIESGVKLIESN